MDEYYLDKCTLYKVVHGSRAYGTNLPDSDYDIKGIAAIPDLEYYFGFANFEQKDSGWASGCDKVIYSLPKFTKLALQCNPNIIEVLFVDQADIIRQSKLIEPILENKRMFLSRAAAKTFSGYALSQLKKLENLIDAGKPIKWKAAGHLIRLSRMGKEIIETGNVVVKRPDFQELLDIRNGKVDFHKVKEDAVQLLGDIDRLAEQSVLPRHPNRELAEHIMINIIRKITGV